MSFVLKAGRLKPSLNAFKFLSSVSSTPSSSAQCQHNLKDVIADKIPNEQKKLIEFRKQHGNKKIGDVTVNMVFGGMRGLLGLVYETSYLDPEAGIHFRGHSIPDCMNILPKFPGGQYPLPESLLWMLLTNDIPTEEQVLGLSKDLADRAEIPRHVVSMLNNFPTKLHPMSQFSAAISSLSSESHFAKGYREGIHRSKYWELVYEDALNLIAKLPTIAAIIYRNLYRDGTSVGAIDTEKDWSANFASMLGYSDPQFTELMRMYLLIHADHEGGNVSAHAHHLVASALADPYLSFSAAMCGLAGPLHGLANQEVLVWLTAIRKELGDNTTDEQIKDFIWKTMKAGKVVPGFGHAVLRVTDPRYTCQREFALKYLADDPLFKLVDQLFRVVPGVLKETGKIKNPWPNVDAHSGVLLAHYGLKEMNYYTVLFGVSRSMGCMAQQLWSRALGFPIERPKSMTSDHLKALVGVK